MADLVQYTATVQPDGFEKTNRVVGTALTAAEAKAELQKKLALMPVTVLSVIEGNLGNTADYPAHAATPYNDMVLTLWKAGVRARAVVIRNASNAYRQVGSTKGLVAIDNADILAFAAAYRDNDGQGGFSVIGGYFKSN